MTPDAPLLLCRALANLTMALYYDFTGEEAEMMDELRDAAGCIIGWRKGLPEQGSVEDDRAGLARRECLRQAVLELLLADAAASAAGQARHLRLSEACLRTVWMGQ